jgi:hypothetical protein
MGKYDPLNEQLAAETGDRWSAEFAELEAVIGAPLPNMARTREDWWLGAAETAQSRSWTAAGWRVEAVELDLERVVFVRGAATGTALVVVEAEPAPEKTRLGLNPAWLGGVAVGAAALAGTLATVWMRRKR